MSHWHSVIAPPRAYDGPVCSGRIRARPADFIVDEVLGFEPDNRDVHTLLRVRKNGANTEWVARRLARAAGVPARDVGFCGLKDRRAVATQWFSLPGNPGICEEDLEGEGLEILDRRPHGRKLRRGSHSGNRFRIRITELDGPVADLEGRLARVADQGVPNYFGPQRFGRNGGNLALAQTLASGGRLDRRQRGFALSAARSAIFNEILGARVIRGDWNLLLSGDLAILDGTHSWFPVDEVDADTQARARSLDLHPSGALWGDGDPPSVGAVGELERAVAGQRSEMAVCLENAGLRQERRALRLPVRDLRWILDGRAMTLEFMLPRGAFATTVVREILEASEVPAVQRRRLSST